LATSEFNQKKPFLRRSVNPALPRIPAQSQNWFAEPNAHRRASSLQEIHLLPAQRDSTLRFSAIHYVDKFSHPATTFDRARGDTKPGGDLLVGTLEPAKFLQLRQIDTRYI
jgi:hypothetical protein